MKKINKQRKDYLSWDEFFMGVAKLAARRSKDPNTQVGACIVSKNNRILSVGYNGTPNGYDDHYFPWDREGDALETKYLYVVHAERNAIFNAVSHGEKEFSALYLMSDKDNILYPCNLCKQVMLEFFDKDVIFNIMNKNGDSKVLTFDELMRTTFSKDDME